jgi:hypothetical protein
MSDEEYYSQDLDVDHCKAKWTTACWRTTDLYKEMHKFLGEEFVKDIDYWMAVRQRFLEEYGGKYREGCQ